MIGNQSKATQPAHVPNGTTAKLAAIPTTPTANANPTAKPFAKRVTVTDLNTMEVTELARFEIDASGQVKARWASPEFKAEIEDHGIAVATGIYRPRDGQQFFVNLELGFANSTLVNVEVVSGSDGTEGEP